MSTENGYANSSSSDRPPDDVGFSDGMFPKLRASSMPDEPLKFENRPSRRLLARLPQFYQSLDQGFALGLSCFGDFYWVAKA